ncbi:MAG TPA: hypothetical protein VER96_36320 [Polyangiaceae bacterium]|nr:hypothetical protein [Polyangiaceae bacterium]
MTVAWSRGAFAGLLLIGCASHGPAQSAQTPPQPPAPAVAPASALVTSTSASPSPAPSSPSDTPPPAGRPCGKVDCLAFATPQAAFEYVLSSKPRVLALGEAHAQAGTTGIQSSTRRFAEQLMPLLAGKAKHIVIELLVANCSAKTVERTAKTQAPVTEHQAKGNQNEFLTLGKVAQRMNIEPQALAPSCAEYDAAAAEGEDGVARLLTLVAQQTESSVEALLAKPETSGEPILTYGGALHNDLSPRPGQESWSFGPQLARATHDRYIELDLIVPEFVKDTDAWRTMPWFPAFDREHLSDETLLYRPSANSYALIFPKT